MARTAPIIIYGCQARRMNVEQLAHKSLISINEARKLLGTLANNLTNEELTETISHLEQIARLSVHDYMVRKNDNINEE